MAAPLSTKRPAAALSSATNSSEESKPKKTRTDLTTPELPAGVSPYFAAVPKMHTDAMRVVTSFLTPREQARTSATNRFFHTVVMHDPKQAPEILKQKSRAEIFPAFCAHHPHLNHPDVRSAYIEGRLSSSDLLNFNIHKYVLSKNFVQLPFMVYSDIVLQTKLGRPPDKDTEYLVNESWFSRGDRYQGNWKNGCFHGFGKLTFSNGVVMEGDFEEGWFVQGHLTYIKDEEILIDVQCKFFKNYNQNHDLSSCPLRKGTYATLRGTPATGTIGITTYNSKTEVFLFPDTKVPLTEKQTNELLQIASWDDSAPQNENLKQLIETGALSFNSTFTWYSSTFDKISEADLEELLIDENWLILYTLSLINIQPADDKKFEIFIHEDYTASSKKESVVYKGQWKEGLWHGKGKMEVSSSQGRQGTGKYISPQTRELKLYYLDLENGERMRHVYEGDFQKGEWHGNGSLIYPNGIVVQGNYEGNCFANGPIKIRLGNTILFEGQFVLDQLEEIDSIFPFTKFTFDPCGKLINEVGRRQEGWLEISTDGEVFFTPTEAIPLDADKILSRITSLNDTHPFLQHENIKAALLEGLFTFESAMTLSTLTINSFTKKDAGGDFYVLRTLKKKTALRILGQLMPLNAEKEIVSYFNNSKSTFRGAWKDGFYHGAGKQVSYSDPFYNSKSTFHGAWKNGCYHGAGKLVSYSDSSPDKEESVCEGNWKNGLRHGKCKDFNAGIIIEHFYKEGKVQDGPGKITFDGHIFKGDFAHAHVYHDVCYGVGILTKHEGQQEKGYLVNKNSEIIFVPASLKEPL